MKLNEILNILLAKTKLIVLSVLIFTVVLYVLVFLIYPVTYTAEVKLLPPEENQNSPLNGLFNSNDFYSVFNAGGSENSQLYAEILKSRSVSEKIVENNDLVSYFDEENFQRAVDKTQKLIKTEVSKEGIITLHFSLKTGFFGRLTDENEKVKEFCAKIANSSVIALEEVNLSKLMTRAKKSREYIESQIEITKSSLANAENELMEFQKRTNSVSISEQLKSAINNAAEVKAELIFTTIQYETIKDNLNNNNAQKEILLNKMKVLEKELKKFNFNENDDDNLFPTMDEAPEIMLEHARLIRDVKIQNEILLLLQKQYFNEKINENRDTPTVDVLDKAIPPLKPSSPRIVLITLFGGMCFFLLLSVFILNRSGLRKV